MHSFVNKMLTALHLIFLLSTFLFIMPVLSAGFGINLMTVPKDDPAEAACTLALLRKYFDAVQPLSGALLMVSISSASVHIQSEILHAIHSVPNLPWSVVIKNARLELESNAQTLHEKPQCYFIIIDNMDDDDLSYAFDDWKSQVNWNPVAQFVVYLAAVEETAEEMTEMMYEILLDFMKKRVFNVNVIGHSEENDEYFGKTVFPYHPDNNCGSRVIQIQTLDMCEYQSEDNESDYEAEAEANDIDNDEDFENLNNAESLNDTLSATNNTFNSNPRSNNSVIVNELHSALQIDKFPKDLSGCPLIAAYRPIEPFIYDVPLSSIYKRGTTEGDYNSANESYIDVSNDDYDDERESLDEVPLAGIEYKMLEIIAEKLHIDIKMRIKNSNVYHLYQQLLDGDIEMVIGGIDEDPSMSQYVSSTVPYLQDDLTWCVAKAKPKHNLFNFLQSFQLETWILTLTYILATTLLIRIARLILQMKLAYMNGCFAVLLRMLGIVLTQSMPMKRLPNVLKLTFGTAFFLSLMLSNVYQSFLVSILTTPRSSFQISHLAEIYEYRMTVAGSVENVRHLNKDGDVYAYIRENFDVCYNIEECLQQAAIDEHLSVAVSRMHSFYNPRIKRDQLYCFGRDENVYVYLVTMLLPKKYHLLHKINPIIQYIIESGHLQKWARDLDSRRQIVDEIRRVQEAEQPFQRITLQQVGGSFVLVVFMLSIAGIVFALELLTYKVVMKKRSRLRLLRMLHYKLLTVTPSTIRMPPLPPKLKRQKMFYRKFRNDNSKKMPLKNANE